MTQIALANLRLANTGAIVGRFATVLGQLLPRPTLSEGDAIHDLGPRILRDLGLEGTPTRQARRFFDAEAQLGMFR
jgi:hypothetical protein